MTRNRLLFITDVFPFPLDRGQHVRIHHLLAACARQFDVTYIAPEPQEGVSRQEVEQYCVRTSYVKSEPHPGQFTASNILETVRLAPGLPSPAKIRYYGPFLNAMREVKAQDFDLIWAERPHIARLCSDFRTRTVIDLDDIEHVKVARRRNIERGALNRVKSAYRYSFYKYLEISWSRRFLATVVCSEQDRDYLARNGCKNAIVVPNAPNWTEQSCTPREVVRSPSTPLRMVFLGNVDSVPNADAMNFLVESILPPLRAERPSVTLDVIGPGVTPEVRAKYAGKIEFRGYVPDLGEALSEYDLLIAPLRFGSGTKLKVLDAMANNLPVVTTNVGAEGLSLVHGRDAWIADTVPDIIEGVNRMKSDVEFANQLAANARTLVLERFSWDAIQDRLSYWLSGLTPELAQSAAATPLPVASSKPQINHEQS